MTKQPDSSKATQTTEPKKPGSEIDDQTLEKVSGGKVTTSDITITKRYDKSSPNLG